MRTSTMISTALFVATTALSGAGAEDAAILKVVGHGAEGRPAYHGGGVVRFLDVSVGAQVVHRTRAGEVPLPLEVAYDVLQPAPILLTSRLGTEYWRLYHFKTETMAAMLTDEKIDLSVAGKHTARATMGRFAKSYGALPENGLVGIRGRSYFLIDRPDGKWIDVTNPPAFFDREAIARKLTFTLADLSKFELSIPEIQSTWRPGGPFRVRLVVTDAGGKVLPVVGAPLVATAGDWQTELATVWSVLDEPTGWMRGKLPQAVPRRLRVTGTVTLDTPGGMQRRKVSASFERGDGQVDAARFQIAEQGYELPRNADGAIRETRAIWVSTSDIATAEKIRELVRRCKRAGLNMIVPDIFVRSTFMAGKGPVPLSGSEEKDLDPLGYLIEKSHAAGLEVHPWFCVTYRDRAFRKWFAEKHGKNVDMHSPDGGIIALGADVHRPAYRRFIADLMVGVARDYDVDGIHLDYIRSMGRCYCDACRREFAEQHGKALSEATEEEWRRWQRLAIGDIVERTARGVRRVRPRAKMSAAVFANMAGGAAQGQDPAGWAKRGWMDLVIPMDYQMQTLQVRAHQRQFLEALDDDDKLVTGLSLYMRSGGQAMPRPPELVCKQIELVRRMGIHGYCLFAYAHFSPRQFQMLREKVNVESAVPYFR